MRTSATLRLLGVLVPAMPVLFACGGARAKGGPAMTASAEEMFLARQYPRDSVDWQDEQAFVADDDNTFGPEARIRSNPYVYAYFNTPAEVEDIAGGVLIAIVDVESGTLGTRYTRLDLAQGRNCVWLAREGTPKKWVAYVSTADPVTGDCSSHSGSTARDVNVSPAPGNTILPIARFTEDANYDPLIGFNCAQQWCDIIPPGASPGRRAADKHPSPSGIDPEWRNPSRYDDEVLAKLSGGPGSQLIKGPRAAIVPVNNLASKRIRNGDFQSFVTVATVLMQEDPANTKYSTQWGMQLGLNEIQVRFYNGVWEGRTVVNGTPTHDLTVHWHPHDPRYRDSHRARWRWDPSDQMGWIDCDAGCCQVTGR